MGRRGARVGLAIASVTLLALAAIAACTGEDPSLVPDAPDGAAADAGAGSDGPIGDAGCGADLATNKEHCGRCGHGCLGGDCVDAACQPVVLFTEDNGAQTTAVGVFGDHVCWARQEPGIRTELRGCRLPDCASTAKTFAYSGDGGYFSAETVTTGIAADSAHVYFTNYYIGRVYRCPADDCPDGSPELFADTRGAPDSIALDDTTAFWANFGTGDGIQACAKSGCGASPRDLVSTSLDAGRALFPRFTLAGNYVYFTSIARGTAPPEVSLAGAPGVYRVDKSASNVAPTIIAQQLDQPYAVAVNGANVAYFTDWGKADAATPLTAGRIDKASLGSVVSTAADRLPKPTSIVLDDQTLYFIGSADGTVRRCSIGNCIEPTIVAKDQADPDGLVQDATALYWYNASSAQVVRLAK